MNKILRIESQELLIRNLRESDLADFHVYRSNPQVTKYQGFDVMNLDEAKKFIEMQKDRLFGNAGEWVQYAIVDKIKNKLVGDCAICLNKNDVRIAEIGITISHTEQKNGYAKAALRMLIDFLFNIPEFHRIVETVDAENTASVRLLESVGFKKEGYFKENIFFKASWGSEYQYAMLKQDWIPLKNKM